VVRHFPKVLLGANLGNGIAAFTAEIFAKNRIELFPLKSLATLALMEFFELVSDRVDKRY
jgi:hypothetical protein